MLLIFNIYMTVAVHEMSSNKKSTGYLYLNIIYNYMKKIEMYLLGNN